MRVSIFGLGYVGCVTAGCLARDGHHVIACDIQAAKVERIAQGLPTVFETGLDELIAEGHRAGLITATSDARQAALDSDVSIICVGTPNSPDGSLDLTAVRGIAQTIGVALRDKPGRHTVINRSTVPAGTAESVLLEALLISSGKSLDDIRVLVVPEFLREGSAIADYYDPPYVVVGTQSGEPGQDEAVIREMFAGFLDKLRWLPFREAEMLKGLCNVFHALKVAFANEVGTLCSSLSMNGKRIMAELVEDKKLNISPAYLRPGLPFGGSCLPKDLRMLINTAHQKHIDLPLLRGILQSNESHLTRAIQRVTAAGERQIGIDGLSFKAGTDDLRESPIVLIVEHLIGKGYDVKVYDPDIKLSYISGANRRYLDEHLPHLSSRLVNSPEDLLEHAHLVVYTREKSAIRSLLAESVKQPLIVDLTRCETSTTIAKPKPVRTAPRDGVEAQPLSYLTQSADADHESSLTKLMAGRGATGDV
ncbi:MAG: UDP-glucose/GDP-mannose dehydrogenase family protein [Planctomycetaceae bacterium]|nr:UDP-glucose/GDP-mannose dehydrogenase family protein [Planctomycetaceae bacterium]